MPPASQLNAPAGRRVSCPGDVDLFELYDSYSIVAALSLEAAGFARRGEGWKYGSGG